MPTGSMPWRSLWAVWMRRRRSVSSRPGGLRAVAERVGADVGVHDDVAVDGAGGAADRLDERAAAAQKALLVSVEDADEAHLRQVEALAQQVDADDDVVDAEAQGAQELAPGPRPAF